MTCAGWWRPQSDCASSRGAGGGRTCRCVSWMRRAPWTPTRPGHGAPVWPYAELANSPEPVARRRWPRNRDPVRSSRSAHSRRGLTRLGTEGTAELLRCRQRTSRCRSASYKTVTDTVYANVLIRHEVDNLTAAATLLVDDVRRRAVEPSSRSCQDTAAARDGTTCECWSATTGTSSRTGWCCGGSRSTQPKSGQIRHTPWPATRPAHQRPTRRSR